MDRVARILREDGVQVIVAVQFWIGYLVVGLALACLLMAVPYYRRQFGELGALYGMPVVGILLAVLWPLFLSAFIVSVARTVWLVVQVGAALSYFGVVKLFWRTVHYRAMVRNGVPKGEAQAIAFRKLSDEEVDALTKRE